METAMVIKSRLILQHSMFFLWCIWKDKKRPRKTKAGFFILHIFQKPRFMLMMLFLWETTSDLIGKLGSFHKTNLVHMLLQVSLLTDLQTWAFLMERIFKRNTLYNSNTMPNIWLKIQVINPVHLARKASNLYQQDVDFG